LHHSKFIYEKLNELFKNFAATTAPDEEARDVFSPPSDFEDPHPDCRHFKVESGSISIHIFDTKPECMRSNANEYQPAPLDDFNGGHSKCSKTKSSNHNVQETVVVIRKRSNQVSIEV
jgi:hypothetical protein